MKIYTVIKTSNNIAGTMAAAFGTTDVIISTTSREEAVKHFEKYTEILTEEGYLFYSSKPNHNVFSEVTVGEVNTSCEFYVIQIIES